MRKNYLRACSSRTSPMADLSALDVHMMHHRILHSKGTYMLLHKHPLHCQLHEENTNPAEYTNPADKKRTLTPRLGGPPPPRSAASQVQILSKHYGRTWGTLLAAAMAAALLSPALPMQNQPCKHHGSTSGGSVSPGCTHDAPSHPIQQRRIHTTAQGPTDHQLHAEDTTPADQNPPTNRIHPAWLAAVTTFCDKLGANHE